MGDGFGKPKLPTVPKEASIDLNHIVGQDSAMFFSILGIDKSFLLTPIEDWDFSPAYLHGKNIVSSLCCVNDAAERGVKLGSDFLDRSKREDNFQNILQIVENNRNKLPNQRKRQMQTQNWFLTQE